MRPVVGYFYFIFTKHDASWSAGLTHVSMSLPSSPKAPTLSLSTSARLAWCATVSDQLCRVFRVKPCYPQYLLPPGKWCLMLLHSVTSISNSCSPLLLSLQELLCLLWWRSNTIPCNISPIHGGRPALFHHAVLQLCWDRCFGQAAASSNTEAWTAQLCCELFYSFLTVFTEGITATFATWLATAKLWNTEYWTFFIHSL